MPALVPRLFDQAYVPAPEAVNVVLLPLHMEVVPPMAAVGRLFTVTVADSLSVQPLALVTVTVYVVLVVGETVMPALLPRLFDHAYIPAPAPEAVSVVLPPVQTEVVPLIDAVAVATVTVAVSESVQPSAAVTVTV